MGYKYKISAGADLFKTAELIEKEYKEYSGGKLFTARFADDIVQGWYEKEEKNSMILFSFTFLTILIMVMGVFAMSMYLIRQKEKEIGVRKVNGATEREILLRLNLDSFKRVLIAFVIACPIAFYAMTKWLQNYVYKINLDWWVFVLAGIVVLLLTLVSVSALTWRAARANPATTLRNE